MIREDYLLRYNPFPSLKFPLPGSSDPSTPFSAGQQTQPTSQPQDMPRIPINFRGQGLSLDPADPSTSRVILGASLGARAHSRRCRRSPKKKIVDQMNAIWSTSGALAWLRKSLWENMRTLDNLSGFDNQKH